MEPGRIKSARRELETLAKVADTHSQYRVLDWGTFGSNMRK